MSKKSSYKASDIEVLEGLDPVRRRPGMYIGGTEGPAGLHQLVKEILDNSIDEAMNGHASQIELTLHSDCSSISIEDNGRGIPVDIHPKFKKSAVELVFTMLHAGGKFSDHNYVSAGGLHGVGASVVNALSEELDVWVARDGYEWSMSFSRGKPKGKLQKGKKRSKTGTRVFFKPDHEIFRKIEFIPARLEKLAQEKTFLNKGLSIVFKDEVNKVEKTFCYPEGVKSYLDHILSKTEDNKKDKSDLVGAESFYLERGNDGKSADIRVELAFCWTDSTSDRVLSYVNGIHTAEGGSHEDGFKSGLSKAIRNYMSVHELVPKGVKLTGEDMREGLIAVLSVNVPGSISQLQFQGQTKDKLNNPEVSPPVETLARSFENVLNSKPQLASAIVERILLAAKARAAARTAAEGVSRKVGVSHRLNLPGKLADCSSTRPDKSELFIVEGESAGGSAKQGRDRETQAVLPLKGKVLNSIAASSAKIKENKELLDLTSAIGCGYGDGIKLDRLRYSKVVILTDADADGMHIAALLMAFFFKFLKPMIKAGHLYLGLSPLYRIRIGAGAKEQLFWVYSDEEKESVLKKFSKSKEVHVTRFKGLGEMNPKTLWETTLNPKTRSLLRVTLGDEALVESSFESLLGRDSSERYRLIQENAHRLDVDI